MRINVYEEEITDEIVLVTKEAAGHNELFYGVRIVLLSSPALSNSTEDDDRSAITFWFSNRSAAVDLQVAVIDALN